jgi:hypothetical protein
MSNALEIMWEGAVVVYLDVLFRAHHVYLETEDIQVNLQSEYSVSGSMFEPGKYRIAEEVITEMFGKLHSYLIAWRH